ncbi:hypothetical protein [Kitasatospora sp. NPDC001683]
MASSVAVPKPAPAALAGILPDDASHPLKFFPIPEGIIAMFSPAQITRSEAWSLLTALFGPLRDVTPEVAR